MQEIQLFDAEKRFMELIWDAEPVNSTMLCRIAQEHLGWKKSTTYSMIRRLCDRGVLQSENAVVRAIISREQARRARSQTLLEQDYAGSVPQFLAAFLQGRKLNPGETEEILRMIEEAK